jgi:hypothetical protein
MLTLGKQAAEMKHVTDVHRIQCERVIIKQFIGRPIHQIKCIRNVLRKMLYSSGAMYCFGLYKYIGLYVLGHIKFFDT